MRIYGAAADAHIVAKPHVAKHKKPPAEEFRPIRSKTAKKRLGQLQLTVDRVGIVSLLCDGRDLFGTLPGFTRFKRPLRVGELVLEADFGDAWGQRIAPFTDPAECAINFNRGAPASNRSSNRADPHPVIATSAFASFSVPRTTSATTVA